MGCKKNAEIFFGGTHHGTIRASLTGFPLPHHCPLIRHILTGCSLFSCLENQTKLSVAGRNNPVDSLLRIILTNYI
ncbi:hypothetical protein CES85_0238 [Ochrobactrum quorumnocens]|uniref:Uncharacterized protein n=1 Tax=Ochrobactrum quorumnocens TaxID=271865 RepID=A0A248UHH1_9HYPH|nr:hypothetical protein CES85_0238 [[Ochrobactrum] quorumnocens]